MTYRTEWCGDVTGAMVGQRVKTRTYDPVADMVSLEETRTRLDNIAEAVRNSADFMPSHDDFITKHCAMRP